MCAHSGFQMDWSTGDLPPRAFSALSASSEPSLLQDFRAGPKEPSEVNAAESQIVAAFSGRTVNFQASPDGVDSDGGAAATSCSFDGLVNLPEGLSEADKLLLNVGVRDLSADGVVRFSVCLQALQAEANDPSLASCVEVLRLFQALQC